MYFIIVIIIVLIFLIMYFKRPETRGKRGENKVQKIIGETIENKQYVIHNLIIENNGKTAQIDHIVINQKAVFVIETKNYSGEIYGLEDQQEWTQILAQGNVKNKLYNPVKQNATHVYNIKKILGKIPIRSLIVFVQNNTEHIKSNHVIPLEELKETLQYGEDILSIKQMKYIYETLLKNKADVTLKKHIKSIRRQKRNLERGICPRCGGNLVLRKGKFGEFWGCSNYPKCKFIKK